MKALSPFEQWMVKSNLQYVKTEGLETVVKRLNHRGYPQIAMGVVAAVDAQSAHSPGPWYTTTRRSARQGLVISELTGANIAVTYDPKDAVIVAASPEMLATLHTIHANAAESADWIRRHAWDAISKAEEVFP